MKYLLLIFLILLTAGCAFRFPPSQNAQRIRWHVDTSFTVDELNDIRTTAITWEKWSRGWVQIDLFQDVDPGDAFAFKCLLEACIFKTVSSSDLVKDKDASVGHNRTLGWVWRYPRNMFLISDRLQNRADFWEVTLHEEGHMLGMGHVPDKNSVMYFEHHAGIRCPSKLDMEEFCRIRGCSVEDDVDWCR